MATGQVSKAVVYFDDVNVQALCTNRTLFNKVQTNLNFQTAYSDADLRGE